MRALITFIAILTVGMVTAQYDFRQNGTENVIEDNTLVVFSGDTYKLVGNTTGTLGGDLHAWYPIGTTTAYQFAQDEMNIDRELVSINIGPSPDGLLNGNQLYSLSLTLPGGEIVSFYSGTTNQTESDWVRNFRGNKNDNGNSRGAIGYRAEVSIDYETARSHSLVYVTISIDHPTERRVSYNFALNVRVGTQANPDLLTGTNLVGPITKWIDGTRDESFSKTVPVSFTYTIGD